MPFCNHCGEILPPGTPVCPECRQDPRGSSTATIRDAAGLHAKLEGFGPAAGSYTPETAQPQTPAQPAPGTRMSRGRQGDGLVPALPLSTEPIRLTVSPAVPGYDPNEMRTPASGDGGVQAPPAPVAQTQEDIIEEFLQTDVSLTETELKVKHLMERADEHVQRARTYRALKNKTQARSSYQRAMKYFDQVIALDPRNYKGRQGRQECLTRISS